MRGTILPQADKLLKHFSIFVVYLRKETTKANTVVNFLNRFDLSDYFLNCFLGKRSIHSYVQAQLVTLHDGALNQLQISKQLEASWYCVQNPIKKYKQLGRFDHLKHIGRPKTLSGCVIRRLRRLIKGDSRLIGSRISTNLNASLPEPVATRTIRRYLKDLAFEYVIKI